MADLTFESKPFVRILRELADEAPNAPAITCDGERDAAADRLATHVS